MAAGALDLCMLAAKYVFCIYIMIEMNRLPALGCVTSLAFLTKLTFVPFLLVDTAVATNASPRRFSVGRVLVTFATLGLNVLASQWEAGFIVVKLGFFPVGFRVAVGAIGA